MAGNLSGLQTVQAGKETVWGTSVTATTKLMGVEEIKIESQGGAALLKEMRGSLAPAFSAIRKINFGKASMKGFATYEDLCYYLESLLGDVTPSGAGPYVRAGAAPLTAVATNRMMTLYDGQSTDVYKLLGAVVNKLVISGKTGEEWKFAADLIGKQKTTGALAVLSDRTVTPIEGGDTLLYIDAWGGTIGTTAIATLATAFELSIDLGTAVRHYLGSLLPGRYRQKKAEPGSVTLKLSLEFDATSKAYLDSFLTYAAVLQHQVRIKGTTGASAIAQLDFAGTIVGEPAMSEEDGVITLDLNYQGTYNSGLANYFKYSITNGVAVLA